MPEFTGERVVPGLVDINLLNEHQARYEFAKRFATGLRVLDAGCGSGYGAAALAKTARTVLAIDSAAEAVDYAREHFPEPNLLFEQGICAALPDGPFDLITAFEVIEHLEDWRGFLGEARRVLAPGGRFMVSTPNKLPYAESRKEAGANPFHVHEFDFAEFQDALGRVFGHTAMFMQNHVEGIVFEPVVTMANVAEALIGASRAVPEEAHFFLAVCANEPLEQLQAFVWVPTAANVLRERERHIGLLEDEIQLRARWMEQSKSELDARNREYEQLLATVRSLNALVEERNAWALQWKDEAERRGSRILELQEELVGEQENFRNTVAAYEGKLTELEEINRAKTEWAFETERRLTAEIADRSRDLGEAVEVLHSVERTMEERTLWAQGLDRDLIEWQQRYSTLSASRWVRLGNRLRVLDRAYLDRA